MAINKVNARSPIYLKIDNSTIEECNLDIYIYTGTFSTNKPASATYTLRKSIISGRDYVIFEISELVRDYIDFQLTDTTEPFDLTTSATNVWVETTATPENANGDALSVVNTIFSAFVGYGYFEDGFTTVTSTSTSDGSTTTTQNLQAFTGSLNALISNDTIYRKSGDTVTIPVCPSMSVNSGSDTLVGAYDVVFKNGNTTVSTVSVDQSVSATADMIFYATSTTATLTKAEIRDSGASVLATINISEEPCTRYIVLPVTFVNKQGAIQTINFFLKSTESISVQTSEFDSNTLKTDADYDIWQHQYKTYAQTGREKITMNTGYVNDSYKEVIRELMISDRIWVYKDSQTLPLNAITKEVTYKNSLNDRIANYTIDFNFAYDKINQIK